MRFTEKESKRCGSEKRKTSLTTKSTKPVSEQTFCWVYPSRVSSSDSHPNRHHQYNPTSLVTILDTNLPEKRPLPPTWTPLSSPSHRTHHPRHPLPEMPNSTPIPKKGPSNKFMRSINKLGDINLLSIFDPPKRKPAPRTVLVNVPLPPHASRTAPVVPLWKVKGTSKAGDGESENEIVTPSRWVGLGSKIVPTEGWIFESNQVLTSKYNILTFLPRNLLEQFRRVANIFFLGESTFRSPFSDEGFLPIGSDKKFGANVSSFPQQFWSSSSFSPSSQPYPLSSPPFLLSSFSPSVESRMVTKISNVIRVIDLSTASR